MASGSPPRAAQPGSPGLRARGLRVTYGGVHALDGVDIDVGQGEIVGVIGPNGSGKTTLLNAMTGFAPIGAGAVTLHGRDVTKEPTRRLARMGLARTFQGVRLFRQLTVYDNVRVALLGCGSGRRRAAREASEIIEQVGLASVRLALAGTLPYGMQRRVALARALAPRPRYLLLDEPAAGLNESESDDLAAKIRSAQQSLGCGVLVIEHDMRLIMGLCHRIQVLENGRTIAVGTPEAVKGDQQVLKAYLGSEGGRR